MAILSFARTLLAFYLLRTSRQILHLAGAELYAMARKVKMPSKTRDTRAAQKQTQAKSTPVKLLDLPAELRLNIIGHVYNLERQLISKPPSQHAFDYRLLHVNQALRYEAFDRLLSSNKWIELIVNYRTTFVQDPTAYRESRNVRFTYPGLAQLLKQYMSEASLSGDWIAKLRHKCVMTIEVTIYCVEAASYPNRPNLPVSRRERAFLPFSLNQMVDLCSKLNHIKSLNLIISINPTSQSFVLTNAAKYLAAFGLIRKAACIVNGLDNERTVLEVKPKDQMGYRSRALSDYRAKMLVYQQLTTQTLEMLPDSSRFSSEYENILRYALKQIKDALSAGKRYENYAFVTWLTTPDAEVESGFLSMFTDCINGYASIVLKLLDHCEENLSEMSSAYTRNIYEEMYTAIITLHGHQWLGMTNQQRAAVHAHLSALYLHHVEFLSVPNQNEIAIEYALKHSTHNLVPGRDLSKHMTKQQSKFAKRADKQTASIIIDFDEIKKVVPNYNPWNVVSTRTVSVDLGGSKGMWTGPEDWVTPQLELRQAGWCLSDSEKDCGEISEKQVRKFEKEMSLPKEALKGQFNQNMMRLLGLGDL